MEEKKFDPLQFIGFVLIALIVTYMLYMNKPAEVAEDKASPSDIEAIDTTNSPNPIQINDSLQKVNLQNTFGIFSNWMVDKGTETQVIENKKLLLEISPKGGLLTKVRLKEFFNYLQEPMDLVKDGNNSFNLNHQTFLLKN